MQIVWMLVIGLIVGALAKFIMPGDDPGGIIVTMLLGVAGAFLGGFIFGALGIGGGMIVEFVGALIGALIILGIYRWWKGRSVTPTTP